MYHFQTPPNFLIATELASHVKPVVIVPEPEPEIQTPEEAFTDDLIDTSTTSVNIVTTYVPSYNLVVNVIIVNGVIIKRSSSVNSM